MPTWLPGICPSTVTCTPAKLSCECARQLVLPINSSWVQLGSYGENGSTTKLKDNPHSPLTVHSKLRELFCGFTVTLWLTLAPTHAVQVVLSVYAPQRLIVPSCSNWCLALVLSCWLWTISDPKGTYTQRSLYPGSYG